MTSASSIEPSPSDRARSRGKPCRMASPLHDVVTALQTFLRSAKHPAPTPALLTVGALARDDVRDVRTVAAVIDRSGSDASGGEPAPVNSRRRRCIADDLGRRKGSIDVVPRIAVRRAHRPCKPRACPRHRSLMGDRYKVEHGNAVPIPMTPMLAACSADISTVSFESSW